MEVVSVVGSKLACQTESWSRGSRRVGLLLILLLVQEALKHPAGLGLDKVTVFVTLNGQDPASTNKVLALYLAQVNQFKNVVVNPRLVFSLLGFDKVLIIVALFCLVGFLARAGLLA